MSVPQEHVEHQYMCSECQQLFDTLEEVLLHQQLHGGEEEEEEREEEQEESRYQCLQCGSILNNPEELLLHQDMHMRGAGQECELSEAGAALPIQYQCLECQALFSTPELWLAHRHTHSRSSTHTHTETEYVVQADGSLAPLQLLGVQNLVLDEQRAGQILHLAQTLREQEEPSQTSTRALLLQGDSSLSSSATLRLQFCSAQAAAHGSAQLLTPVQLLHPYECSECGLLFSSPEDFLQHQGQHFLPQEKESGEAEPGPEERGGAAGEEEGRVSSSAPPGGLECEKCERRFTSASRLVAHLRVHEQGTHKCPDCGRVFKKLLSLQTHAGTHSGEARFLCVDCGHGFTTEMTLMIHRKTHTQEPLHKCPFCAKTFTNMTKFLYHRRTHRVREATAPASQLPASQSSVMQKAWSRASEDSSDSTPLLLSLARVNGLHAAANQNGHSAPCAGAGEEQGAPSPSPTRP